MLLHALHRGLVQLQAHAKRRGQRGVGLVVVGGADAAAGEDEAAGAHARPQAQRRLPNLRVVVRHALYPRQVDAPAMKALGEPGRVGVGDGAAQLQQAGGQGACLVAGCCL